MQKINYTEKDWKYLIIFDACRYDAFEFEIRKHPFEGWLHEIDSGATHTDEWYHVHWEKADKSNIHLISSNAHPFLQSNAHIADGFKTATKAWWVEIDPMYTFNQFLQVKEKYPNDRFLIHFVPPHLPFVTERGKELMNKLKEVSMLGTGPNVYKAMEAYAKKHGWKEIKSVYAEQIKYMLDLMYANLMFFDDGKIAITADHAELIGEGGIYNHPPRSEWDKILRRVPYFEVKK